MNHVLVLGLIVIAVAVIATARQFEVRLVLFLAALALGILGGHPELILQKFWATFSEEKFAVPICSAMGFAYVLKHTGCDRHLVHLLVQPLVHVRPLLIPGTVLVGFLVNMPIVSQTSTAVTIGTVLIPVLRAANLSSVTIGAAILLGSSIGGELFNPGAPELRTTIEESRKVAKEFGLDEEQFNKDRCVQRIFPLNLVGLIVGTLVFWYLSWRHEKKLAGERGPEAEKPAAEAEFFRVNYFKAAVPVLPLVLLYISSPPLNMVEVPLWWLEPLPKELAPIGRFESRLIGTAMLAGVAVAALASWRNSLGVMKAFFDGAGYGFANIVSLIIIAQCFGEGIRQIGLDKAVVELIALMPGMLLPAAGMLALGFAFLCGSGMASTQSLFPFFAKPAYLLGIDPTHAGAVVSVASAAGRTMSPVAAVTLMSASMTGVNPLELVRRVSLPLLLSTLAMILAAMAMAPPP